MIKFFLIVDFLFLSMIVFAQQSQPFGLKMGMTLNEARDVCDNIIHFRAVEVPDFYYFKPKNGSVLFCDYYVRIHSKQGIYLIGAEGNIIYSDKKDTEIKAAFNDFVLNIANIYGSYEIVDYIDATGYLYYAIWEREKGSNIPEDMSKIIVKIISLSQGMGYITIEYYSLYEASTEEEVIDIDYSMF